MTTTYSVLGIMSGSSLDGLDLASCKFHVNEPGDWQYNIVEAETIPYSEEWLQTLKNATGIPGEDLIRLNVRYGRFLGEISREFLSRKKLTADFISSHGHTIFHNPVEGFTFQLGEGQSIAAASGLRVVCDFRTKDISMGGQGAPLVPIGDEMLFPDYDACLNIGGIANLSFRKDGKRVAFDVCPANQLLNALSRERGVDFDEDGRLAESGTVDDALIEKLNTDPYYTLQYPKSLSNEYVKNNFLSYLNGSKLTTEVKLRTVTEHIAEQIAKSMADLEAGNVLVTGGGAHNSYLINRLKKLSKHEFVLPDNQVVDFKEALIFGFMGVLKMRNESNCMASVTGATMDTCSGLIFYP